MHDFKHGLRSIERAIAQLENLRQILIENEKIFFLAKKSEYAKLYNKKYNATEKRREYRKRYNRQPEQMAKKRAYSREYYQKNKK